MSRTSEACHVDDQKNLASEPVQGDQVLLVDIVQGKVVHSCVRLLRVSAKVVISDPRFGSHQPRQQGEADCFAVHHGWAVQRRLCPMSPALSSSPKPYPNLGALVCSLTTSLYSLLRQSDFDVSNVRWPWRAGSEDGHTDAAVTIYGGLEGPTGRYQINGMKNVMSFVLPITRRHWRLDDEDEKPGLFCS